MGSYFKIGHTENNSKSTSRAVVYSIRRSFPNEEKFKLPDFVITQEEVMVVTNHLADLAVWKNYDTFNNVFPDVNPEDKEYMDECREDIEDEDFTWALQFMVRVFSNMVLNEEYKTAAYWE